MVNRSSHAAHIPQRTCVVCRRKKSMSELIRFAIIKKNVIFDLKRNIQDRGYYVCDENKCIKKIDKWVKKHKI